MHDLHEAQTYLYASTGTGPYNDALDPITDQRVVDAGAERRDGDDQARRARRVDLRVLRRLGAELHVLHRAHATTRSAASTKCRATAPTTTRCAPARRRRARNGSVRTRRCRTIKWGPRNNTNIQQSALLFSLQPRREEQGAVPRELLAEEQARGRQGQERPDLRLGDSRRAAPQGRRRRRGQRAAAPGPRSAHAPTAPFKAGNVDVDGRRLHHPRRSAVPHARRHVLLASRTTRRRIRRRTTTPAGRSSSCATSRSQPVTDKSDPRRSR